MKRVLAIDGGGIRGIIPAWFCSVLEEKSGKRIHELFDLVAGTSTGGILTLGYVKPPDGKTGQEMFDLYRTRGKQIFGSKSLFGSLLKPKYAIEPFQTLLEEYFDDALLSQALTPVMVTAYDIRLRRPHVFKSWTARRNARREALMRDVARATSAAPTYFEPVEMERSVHVDGGIMANNPAAAAYAEARRLWPDEVIVLVSVGSGSLTKPLLHRTVKSWGKLKWSGPLIDCVLDGASKTTDYVMDRLLPKGQYHRFQASLAEASQGLDSVSESSLAELEMFGKKLVAENKDRIDSLISVLLSRTARPAGGQLYALHECVEDLNRRISSVESISSLKLDAISVDLSFGLDYAMQMLRRPDIKNFHLRLLILVDDPARIGRNMPQEVREWCAGGPAVLRRISQDLDSLSEATCLADSRITLQVKSYDEFPTLYGFRVTEPFKTCYATFCRWKPPDYGSYNWGESHYHMVDEVKASDADRDLASLFNGLFEHYWGKTDRLILERILS